MHYVGLTILMDEIVRRGHDNFNCNINLISVWKLRNFCLEYYVASYYVEFNSSHLQAYRAWIFTHISNTLH
jgi:hypothetical protein